MFQLLFYHSYHNYCGDIIFCADKDEMGGTTIQCNSSLGQNFIFVIIV